MQRNVLVLAILTTSISAFAQGTEKDFGNLLQSNGPEQMLNHDFRVTNTKSTLSDSAQVPYWNLITSPQKEEFTFKLSDRKSPRNFPIFGKKASQKVIIERQNGQVSRLSKLTWLSYENSKSKSDDGFQFVDTTAISPEGYVTSQTRCEQEFKFNIVGSKSRKSSVGCTTVNLEVCSYIASNKLESEFETKLKECTEVFRKITRHQEALAKLAEKDHSENITALKKLEKKISSFDNSFTLTGQTLESLNRVSVGLNRAINHCTELTEKNWFESARPFQASKPSAKGSKQ